MNIELTTTGTIDDVAAFFRVSRRMVTKWRTERPPALAFWREGGCVCFGEEAVVAFRAKRLMRDENMSRDDAVPMARREWREHLRVRSQFDDLEKRIARLESVIQAKESIAA